MRRIPRDRAVSLFFVSMALMALCALAPAQEPVPAAPAEQSISQLEQQLNVLQERARDLETQNQSAEKERAGFQSQLNRVQSQLWLFQGFQFQWGPMRRASQLIANAAFIFGVIALILLVTRWPHVARKLFSFSYPFAVPVPLKGALGEPLSSRARTVWVVILIVLFLLLTLPALGEEDVPSAVPATGEAAAVAAEMPEAPVSQPESGVEQKMEEAVLLMELSPVDRAIRIMEGASEDVLLELYVGQDILSAAAAAAAKHGHPPLLAGDPTTLKLRRGSFAYSIVLASLYESKGRPEVLKTLEEGIRLLPVENLADSRAIPYAALNALIQWLAAYGASESAEPLFVPCAQMAPDVEALKSLVAAARKLGFDEKARDCIESALPKSGSVNDFTTLIQLALDNQFRDLALQALETYLPRVENNIDSALQLIRLLHAIDVSRAETELEKIVAEATLDRALAIADAAEELSLPKVAQSAIARAANKAVFAQEIDEVTQKAAELGLSEMAWTTLAARMRGNMSMASWAVSTPFPKAFGAQWLDGEQVSLGVLVGAALFSSGRPAEFAVFFEAPVASQLDDIIASLGTNPELRLNDLYGLARYYEAINDSALEATLAMVDMQQRLRGLDKAGEGVSQDDAQRIALQMQIEQLTSMERHLREQLEATRRQAGQLRSELQEARITLILRALEIAAKGILILIAVWIAFARAVAAARAALGYRFSHFCWTLLETLGFEACCTVIFIFPGAIFTLLAQDRLKHLQIAEIVYPLPDAVASAEEEAAFRTPSKPPMPPV